MAAEWPTPAWACGVRVLRSVARRRTAELAVTPDRLIEIRVPDAWTNAEVVDLLRRREAWLQRQSLDLARFEPRSAPRTYASGETCLHLGRQYLLRLQQAEPGESESVTMGGTGMVVRLHQPADNQHVRNLMHRWRLAQARDVFNSRIEKCLSAPMFKLLPQPRVRLKTMAGRWGSMSANRVMTLNPALVQAPLGAIDAVIQHELCHMLVRPHDRAFFELMDRINPRWRQERQRLELLLR
jgi:predicted metal-dependent hydrolase